VKRFPERPTTKHRIAPTKPFFQLGEVTLKPTDALMVHDQTTGCDHGYHYSQHDLSAIPPSRSSRHRKPGRKAVIETTAATCRFLSIGVFLAVAFGACHTR